MHTLVSPKQTNMETDSLPRSFCVSYNVTYLRLTEQDKCFDYDCNYCAHLRETNMLILLLSQRSHLKVNQNRFSVDYHTFQTAYYLSFPVVPVSTLVPTPALNNVPALQSLCRITAPAGRVQSD